MKNKLMIITLALVALCSRAQSEVVYFNYISAPVETSVTNARSGAWISSYISLTAGGAVLSGVEPDPGILVLAYMNTSGDNGAAQVNGAYQYNTVLNDLTIGDTVDASSAWGPQEVGVGLSSYGGEFEDTSLLGFRLDMGGGDYNYGWVRFYQYVNVVETGAGSGFSTATGRILEMAYENNLNTAITTGVVPEPASALMLCFGAVVGLATHRVRRLAQRR